MRFKGLTADLLSNWDVFHVYEVKNALFISEVDGLTSLFSKIVTKDTNNIVKVLRLQKGSFPCLVDWKRVKQRMAQGYKSWLMSLPIHITIYNRTNHYFLWNTYSTHDLHLHLPELVPFLQFQLITTNFNGNIIASVLIK